MHSRLLRTATLSIFLQLAMSQSAEAQLEEIVVTAQKREQLAQAIGLSITTFSDEALEELQARDMFAIANQLPNAQVYTSANLPSFTLRGVGLNEFSANFDAPVAVHIDEVYISKPFMVSMPFFDLDRVEVLKGPQGTLFGRNTTGGSVNYYLRAPSKESEAQIELGFDNHQRYRIEGFAGGPMGDNVSWRLSALVNQSSGGPFKNLLNGEELGGWDQQMLRAQLLFDFDRTDVRVLVHGGTDESSLVPYKGPGIFNFGGGFCPELLSGVVTQNADSCTKFGGLSPDPGGEFEPQDTFTVNQDYHPLANNTAAGGYIRVDHEFSWATFTSITANEYFERDQREDSDGSIFASANTDWYTKIRQFTQELRLTGETERWRYVAGAYFENDRLDEVDSADTSENPFGLLPPFAPRLAAEFSQDVRSYAAYIHNEFDLGTSFTLNAGIRATWEDTDLNGSTFLGANDPAGIEDFVTPVIPVDSRIAGRSDNNLSYRIGIQSDISEQWLLFANLSTGFRSGGFSVPFGGVITEFSSEEMTTQEIGAKGRLLNNSLQLNIAVFRNDYDDLQVNVDDPTSLLAPVTRNVGSSETIGFEGEGWWFPNENFDAKFGIGYLDSDFSSERVITTYSGVVPLDGKNPVNTPKWTYSGLLRYRFPISRDLELMLMTDFRWTDERYLEATNQPFDLAESFFILNFRAAIESADDRWQLAVWGANVTDEEYLTYINNSAIFKLDIFGEPATYGVSLRYRFR